MIVKPYTPRPLLDAGDSINDSQIWFLLGNEGAGLTVKNLATQKDVTPGTFDGTLQAGVSWSTDLIGAYPKGNGSATGYVDLGVVAPSANGTAIVGTAAPATFMWVESVDPAATISGFYGVATIGTGSSIFVLLKNDSGAYASLTASTPSTTNNAHWATAPTLASGKGITRVWILRAPLGLLGNQPTSFKLMVDGTDYGNSTTGVGNSLGAFTGNNRLGWDSADPKFPGGVHCARLWNRVLSDSECQRLCNDPTAGIARRRQLKVFALYRMLLAM